MILTISAVGGLLLILPGLEEEKNSTPLHTENVRRTEGLLKLWVGILRKMMTHGWTHTQRTGGHRGDDTHTHTQTQNALSVKGK